MSMESILTIVGLVVSVMLFFLGVIVALVGFFLSRQLKQIDEALAQIPKIGDRLLRLEVIAGLKRPSDVLQLPPRGSA